MFKKIFHQIIFLLLCFIVCNFSVFDAFAEENVGKSSTTLTYDDEIEDIDFGTGSSIQTINDPLEKYNRKIFSFNEFIDINIFDPIAKSYRNTIPKPIRNSVGNVIKNLSLPFTCINSVLQGNAENATGSFSAFLINTTLGIGGIFDVAGTKKVEYRKEDFGKTFAKYGVGQGPYLMIPLLGPSTLRDFSGYLVEKTMDPLSFNKLQIGGKEDIIDPSYRISLSAISALNTRESLIDILDDARKDSFDLYATIRSAYLQRRNFEITKQ